MSYLKAKVTGIHNHENLNIVHFDFNGTSLAMMSLDLCLDIKINSFVKLAAKPSHVAIAKSFDGQISYSNQLSCTVEDIENGKLLSVLKLKLDEDAYLHSIITLNSSKKMDLKVGDEITAFIKASELSIVEVLQ
ncbi:MAG: TOBE domain-containing protein [Campylobacterota bacterium]|nr:TOBE domain-containing protein [Campylobacterota bacterium]